MIKKLLSFVRAVGVCLVGMYPLPGAAQTTDQLRMSASRAPIDLSFLNEAPAGLHGPVQVDGPNLIFADGTPVRFWGANVQAYAIFSTEPAQICYHARRLAALGFNLVRLHHHDSTWVTPNIFGREASDTLSLDPMALDRIGRWVACLKAEGIYTWLDLHVGRHMGAAEGIDYADEVTENGGSIKGFNFVNDSIRERMSEFQAAYLSYENPHTGLAFKDDPAIAAVMISNENDATYHFGNRLLPDKNVPLHNALYMERAAAFADAHNLDPNQVWRSWEYGPSKIFLNDLEREFFAPLTTEIKDLGFRGLITTSGIWGGMGAAGLPSLMVGDIIDVHSYGSAGLGSTDPDTNADMVSIIAGAQVAGMPLSISEWNISPWPEPDRFLAPLRMGAAAAHQGWDAPIIYGYAQSGLGRDPVAYNWHIAEDPSLLGPLAVAALMYRRGDVSLADTTVAISPDAETLFSAHHHATTSPLIRDIAERSRLVTILPEIDELPWLSPTLEEYDIAHTRYDADSGSLPGRVIFSDTDEIRRNPQAGLIWINTPQTLIVAGELGNEIQTVGDLRVDIDANLGGVAVQSLDGAALKDSGDLLITVMGPSTPIEENRPPFLVDRITGTLTFAAAPELQPVGDMLSDGTGRVSHRQAGNSHQITFDRAAAISWIRLKRP